MLRGDSVGRLIANTEAKIVDPDTGIALPPGEKGELWIKGPTIMQGTFNYRTTRTSLKLRQHSLFSYLLSDQMI